MSKEPVLMHEEVNTDYTTVELEDKVSRCESTEELKEEILPLIRAQSVNWSEKIGEIFKASGLGKKEFAQRCGISRVMLDKWLKGALPNSRERFIRIGLSAGYGKEEMDRLLQRYGRYPGLYAKSLEDLVCLYVMGHADSFASDKDSSLYDAYEEILNEIRTRILSSGSGSDEEVRTTVLERRLSEVSDKDELAAFIDENSSVFAMSFRKLYSYILTNLDANEDDIYSSSYAMAQIQGWSSSLRQCISAIKQNKWYPTRNKIISIGFHLSMDYDQINEMLEIAHMEPLCAKNIFESVLIYILNDAALSIGLDKGEEGYDLSGLCLYGNDILKELDIPEISEFIAEIRIPDPDDER